MKLKPYTPGADMSQPETPNNAESIALAHRRTILIELLSEAVCRLAGVSVNPRENSKTRSNICETPLTELDSSDKTRLNVSDVNPLSTRS